MTLHDKSNSTDIAEHTYAPHRYHDLPDLEPPEQDESCEAVDSIHDAAWFVVAALVCAAVALVIERVL